MPCKLRIKDAIILVTGSGQGIGRSFVTEIPNRGGRPIAVEFDPAFKAELSAQIGDRGALHIADVRNAKEMTAVAEQTIRDYGGIDDVIANAGIERVAPTVDMDPKLSRRSSKSISRVTISACNRPWHRSYRARGISWSSRPLRRWSHSRRLRPLPHPRQRWT